MRKPGKTESLSAQLRRIIAAEPSCYDLAGRAGVSRSTLTRFLKVERGLTTDTVDRLAAVPSTVLALTTSRRWFPGAISPLPPIWELRPQSLGIVVAFLLHVEIDNVLQTGEVPFLLASVRRGSYPA